MTMQESAISWTTHTWNPVHGCSIVSDGCKNCYAMKLSLDRGWTEKPWTQQNEADNVLMKPHKLVEPYSIEPGERVFVNSMSDMLHRAIPDWYRAVVFAIMITQSDNVFQVLTKRPENTIDWPQRFEAAIRSQKFGSFMMKQKGRRGRWKRVYKALKYVYTVIVLNERSLSPWAANIWMGTSVEDERVLHRIDHLRQNTAKVRFISAEPLLGPYPIDTDLSGIDWVIVGGESGDHMEEDAPRWMKQEWARTVRDLCVDQGVAFFYKQDSARRTEVRTALEHESGQHFIWNQYPRDLAHPWPATRSGKPLSNEEVNADPTIKVEAGTWMLRVEQQRKRALQPAPLSPERIQQLQGILAGLSDTPRLPAPTPPRKLYTGRPGILQSARHIQPRVQKTSDVVRQPKPKRHTITVHTARIWTHDPDALNITIKRAHTPQGKLLAPLWDMVIQYKHGIITAEQYTERYRRVMRDRYSSFRPRFLALLRDNDRLVLTCYCGVGDFCHRHLAVDILEKIATEHDINFIRGGELEEQPRKDPPHAPTRNEEGITQPLLL